MPFKNLRTPLGKQDTCHSLELITVIPIIQPDKDYSELSSYRPIDFTP